MNSVSFGVALLILFTAGFSAFLAEPSSKGKTWAKRSLLTMAAINSISGIYLLINSTRGAEEQNARLRQIATDQQTAIKAATELAKNLNAAQDTTNKIAAKLSATSTTVDNVLTETRRGLQPLETMGIQFVLNLSGSNPGVASTLEIYRQSAKSMPPLNFDARNFLLTAPMKSLGVAFLPGSPLYPKPETGLGLVTRSYRVNVQFHIQHHRPAVYAENNKPSPDLAIDFVEDLSQPLVHPSRELGINEGGSLLYFLFSNVTRNAWHTNGKIMSVTDLLKCQVVAQPTFAVPPVDEWQKYKIAKNALEEAQRIWESVTLNTIILSTQDGRRWAFDVPKSQTVQQMGVPIFVGQFDRLLTPLEAR